LQGLLLHPIPWLEMHCTASENFEFSLLHKVLSLVFDFKPGSLPFPESKKNETRRQ